MSDKIQFASPQWVDLMETVVARVVAGRPDGPLLPDGDQVVFGQTFYDVPPSGHTTEWGVVFTAQGAEFVRGHVEATVGIRGTYEAILPIAHFEFGTADRAAAERIQTYWESQRQLGTIEDIGDMAALPARIRIMVQAIHDGQVPYLA
jgi:hypothetical protein